MAFAKSKEERTRSDIKLVLPSPLFSTTSQTTKIIKKPLSSYPDHGFLLYNLLSPEECEYLITQSEKWGYIPLRNYSKGYRNNQRVMIESAELANLLLERVKPFVPAELVVDETNDQEIMGDGYETYGRWQLNGLNNVWRFCRYLDAGHFAPHRDGVTTINADERSVFTLMLYLNSGFTGGTTNFLSEEQPNFRNQEMYKAEEQFILERVVPEPGMALIFHHHCLHEGEAVRGEKKYILRSDLMYKRVERTIPPRK